eukprot:3349917-Pyramimonas_sp.AAC.1
MPARPDGQRSTPPQASHSAVANSRSCSGKVIPTTASINGLHKGSRELPCARWWSPASAARASGK